MSHNGSDEVVDRDWYRRRYPDVDLLGMDPADHYWWLGRRIGRKPVPEPVGSTDGPKRLLAPSKVVPYSNEDIGRALRSLLRWLFPGDEALSSRLLSEVSCNFWNEDSGRSATINPNGKLVVEFMSDWSAKARAFRGAKFSRRPNTILLVSYYAPSRSHAGGLRILDAYGEIRARFPHVKLTLVSARHREVDGDISILSDLFDTVHFCEPDRFSAVTIKRALADNKTYDLVDLQFQQAGLLAADLRALGKRLIFTPMEVLSRSDFDLVVKQTLEGSFPLNKFFSLIHRGAEERQIMQSVDATVCVSDADAEFMTRFAGRSAITYFPTGLSPTEFGAQLKTGFKSVPIAARKKRLVFAAYFGSETNSRGLEWYLKEVHPQVLKACPDYNLAVVGRGDTTALEAMGATSVSFIGEVPKLSPVLEQCKAGLVLALHGSGFRGKINQYSLCGMPSVSTSLGATGLSYEDGKDILIANDPQEFAAKCIRLLSDDGFTQRLGDAARKRALGDYTWAAVWPQVAAVYGLS
jgi:glycosyltransferase involved in cell wall biosynthesis